MDLNHPLWQQLAAPADSPLLMGVLNLTPNSFSDGGTVLPGESEDYVSRLLQEGAHIIDIGGESTAPGRTHVSSEEELRRIESTVASYAPRSFISVDTRHADTAERCLSLGAKMINDVTALRADPRLAEVIAAFDAYVVLMYSKQPPGAPHASNDPKEYVDVIAEIGDFLETRIAFARSSGIKAEKILIDPGMGIFVSPNPIYSFEVLRRLEELCKRFSEFPLLIGTSRKGFLGGALKERDPISQLSALFAVERGARLIRTHNVAQAAAFLDTAKKCSPEKVR